MWHLRLKTSPALAPDTRMRTVTRLVEVSVTSRLAMRPSQRLDAATTWASWARSAATGTRQSRTIERLPVTWVPRRDQLAKGFSVKYLEGRMRRRSSQTRTTT